MCPDVRKRLFVYCRFVQRLTRLYRLNLTIIAAMLTVMLIPSASNQQLKSPFYKLFSRGRPAIAPDPATLLIEVHPETVSGTQGMIPWSEFFLILEEMGAEQAVLTLPEKMLESSYLLSSDRKEHVQYRFDEEFDLIKKNIASLFDAILYGAVRPRDAVQFVENLLSLTDKSKERLVDDTIHIAAKETLLLDKVRRVFGEDNLGTAPMGLGYSFPEFDAAITVADYPRLPDDTLPFRRLPMELINNYLKLDEELVLLLTAMEKAGYLSGTQPDMYPTFLYEHVRNLLLELLDAPQEKTKNAWLGAKKRYEQSVSTLLLGKTETELDKGFANLLTDGVIEETQGKRIQEQRDHLAEAFSETRKAFADLMAVKELLSQELRGALCIVGIAPDPERKIENVWSEPTAAEAAAAEIQSIRSGRHSLILTGWKQRVFIAIPGLFFTLLLSALSLPMVFLIGFLAMLATGAGFFLLYITTGIFVHPIYAALAPGAAVIATVFAVWLLRIGYARRINPVTGNRFPRLNQWVLGTIGKSPAESLRSNQTVILAVRCRSVIKWEADRQGVRRAAILREFHRAAGRVIKKHGGVIVGADGDVVLAGFGTPFNTVSSRTLPDLGVHVNNALLVASDLSRRDAGSCDAWSCGLDAGECSFYFSSLNGFSVEGSTAVYARILSGLASRYENHILATADIVKAAGKEWTGERLDSMVDKANGMEMAFYALIYRPKD